MFFYPAQGIIGAKSFSKVLTFTFRTHVDLYWETRGKSWFGSKLFGAQNIRALTVDEAQEWALGHEPRCVALFHDGDIAVSGLRDSDWKFELANKVAWLLQDHGNGQGILAYTAGDSSNPSRVTMKTGEKTNFPLTGPGLYASMFRGWLDKSGFTIQFSPVLVESAGISIERRREF